MQLTSWFQDLLDEHRPRYAGKNYEKYVEKKAMELTANQQNHKGPCTKAALSSSSRPFFSFNTREDTYDSLARALSLTAVIGCLHKDAGKYRLELIKGLLQKDSQWDDLVALAEDVLALATGYGCENLKDYAKRPLGFIKGDDFIKNFSPWTLKMRDSRTNAPNGHALPAYPEANYVRQSPPVGITTATYGYYVKHCVRNNRGLDVNHFLNLQIEIDGRGYPLQALLSLQVFPDFARQAIKRRPELQALSEALMQQLQASLDFGEYAQVGPDQGIRLLVDVIPYEDFEEDEIEITPVTSVQFVEDFQATYAQLASEYQIISRKLHRTMTVGDGNPVNVGAFASNRNGQITHVGQSDYLSIPPRMSNRINRLFNARVINRREAERYAQLQHPQESDYNFKQRKLQGFEKAVNRYLNFCRYLYDEIFEEINDKTAEGVYADRHDFLSAYNTDPKKKSMLQELLEGFKNEAFIDRLSWFVIKNLFSHKDLLSPGENQENIAMIQSVIWRKLA